LGPAGALTSPRAATRHAFVESRLLVDVASDVLARRLRLDQEPDGTGDAWGPPER